MVTATRKLPFGRHGKALSFCALIALLLLLPAGSSRLLAEEEAPAAAAEPAAPAADAAKDAPATDLWHQPYFLNWGTKRQELANRGVNFDFFYVIDSFGVLDAPDGTRREYNGWGRIRGTVDIDLGRFGMPHGMTYHATGLWQYGQNMGTILGSIANPSGLVSIHTFRLDSMWVQQALFEGKLQLKAGQFATEDFYGIQEYGGNFITEPLDYAFGNLGNVRASWDPTSSPAGEIKIAPVRSFYFKTGVYAPRNYSDTGFNYHKSPANGLDSSATWNSEVGYITFADSRSPHANYRGVVKVGSIYNGGKFVRYPDAGLESGNFLIYVQGAQPIYRTGPGTTRGLDLTAGVSTGPSDKSKVPTEATFGLTFNGPITARPHDALSVGVVYSGIGNDYNRYLTASDLPTLSNETEVEVNYKAQLTPWLVLQPAVQHYASVGGNSGKSATIAGMRLKVTF